MTTFSTSQRRVFLMTLAAAATGAVSVPALAKVELLDEKDPAATGLGYTQDASKVNTKKFPNYAAGQSCASCVMYQGKAGDASGVCPLYAGKHVAAKGWCGSYSKRG